MFEKINQDIRTAERYIPKTALLNAVPVYLFPVRKESERVQFCELRNLLVSLEEEEIFLTDSDDIILLYPDYGLTENGLSSIPGLYNESGVFKSTLEQWMVYLNVQCNVSQGIVYIHPDCADILLSEALWFQKLLRQLSHYKGKFLFLIGTEQEYCDKVYDVVKNEVFCRRTTIDSPGEKQYLEMAGTLFRENGIIPDNDAAVRFTELLKKYHDKINTSIVELWLQEIIWNCVSKEHVSYPPTLLEEDFDETLLLQHLETNPQSGKIGFS